MARKAIGRYSESRKAPPRSQSIYAVVTKNLLLIRNLTINTIKKYLHGMLTAMLACLVNVHSTLPKLCALGRYLFYIILIVCLGVLVCAFQSLLHYCTIH